MITYLPWEAEARFEFRHCFAGLFARVLVQGGVGLQPAEYLVLKDLECQHLVLEARN